MATALGPKSADWPIRAELDRACRLKVLTCLSQSFSFSLTKWTYEWVWTACFFKLQAKCTLVVMICTRAALDELSARAEMSFAKASRSMTVNSRHPLSVVPHHHVLSCQIAFSCC